MIDFKITFQDDELFYGDNEKMSQIPKMMLRKFLRQFKTITFFILSVSSSISSILFYQNRPDLSNVMLF